MDILQSLPNEILAYIVSNLPVIDLINTCLVSHRLNAISQQFLFKDAIISTPANPGRISRTSPKARVRAVSSLQKLLRTLITPGRETLAAHVHSLTLNWVHPGSRVYGPTPQRPINDIDLLRPYPSSRALELQTPSKQVFLLLLRLTRLRTLSIIASVYPHHFEYFPFDAFTDMPASLFQSSFRFLREFRYNSTDAYCSISCKTLLLLLNLPSIRYINVQLIDESDITPEPSTVSTSPVTQLCFWEVAIRPCVLLSLLKIPRALTHFLYGTYKGHDSRGLLEFGPALEPLRETLQYLYLDLSLARGMEIEDTAPGLPYILSLGQWPKLRTVRCSLMLLLGSREQDRMLRLVDVLPHTLRMLQILPDHVYSIAMVVREVLGLLEQKRVVAPGLQKVAVTEVTGELGETLKAVCDAARVELVMDWSVETIART